MKKNLLSLTACLIGITAYTQTSDTYINDNVTVKVNPNTLFYHGGNVTIESATNTDTEKIINEGNIQIVGNFSNNNTTGSNFVNKYNSPSNYGQVIIDQNANVTGLLSLERSKPNQTVSGNEYPIAIPFNGKVNDIINTISSGIFKGNCPVDFVCGMTRYDQSLFSWNISKTTFDATVNTTDLNPINSYLLNLRSGKSIQSALEKISGAIIKLNGAPSNKSFGGTFKSGIINFNDADFNLKLYKDWKQLRNAYHEDYQSYLGPIVNNTYSTSQDNSVLFGKNLHRFGNPYTSNLDLSNINSWLGFKLSDTGETIPATNVITYKDTPTTTSGALTFSINKPASNYSINWGEDLGNITSGASTIHKASLERSGTSFIWTGSPEALLIKPFETFYISYISVNGQRNNGAVIRAVVNLNDKQKTFKYQFNDSNTVPNTPQPQSRSLAVNKSNDKISSLRADKELIENGLVSTNDFTQLEIYLSSDNEINGNAVYLANSPEFSNKIVTQNNNSFYVINPESETNLEMSIFNSENYIAKPFKLGFNNLKSGKNYSLLFNLYEYSILNKVNNLSIGKYYIYDEQTKKYTDITGEIPVTFTYDDKTNDRFTLYWLEKPKSSSPIIEDEVKEEEIKSHSTDIYKNNTNLYVRFENNNTTAKIEVFDLLGRLISTKSNINTNNDYKLNLNNNIYIVVITYADGKVVTKKSIN